MKNSRFKYSYRENASKLHKAVGEVLRTGEAFGEHEAYQEYPVNRVNTDYPDGSHHFDWVIPDLGVVIECHGIQHFKVVDWEGGEPEKAIAAFKALKERDFAKREAAWAAGYIYVEIPYLLEKSINETLLLQRIDESKPAYQEFQTSHSEELARQKAEKERALQHARTLRARVIHQDQKARMKEIRQEYLQSDAHKAQLEKAKQARVERYLRLKEDKHE